MPAITPLEPPTFPQAMNLEKVSTDDEIYMSTFPALSHDYEPGQPLSSSRTYGGHTYGQGIWAASLAMRGTGLFIHEANGYWTQAGYPNRPMIYEVKTLSQTKSFVLRQVTGRQPTTPSEDCPFPRSDAAKELGPTSFVMTCSFKRKEQGPAYGLKFGPEKYGDLWKEDPTSYPAHIYFPRPDGGRMKLAQFPGIELRTPDLQEYNMKNTGTASRRVHVYRASEAIDVDPNMMAAAHGYVSDRAGMSVLLQAFGMKSLGVAASLSHKIIFHVSPEELALTENVWFIQEMSTSRGGEGRGVIDSRIWGPSGELVATTIQDGLMRSPVQAKLA